MDFRIFIFSKIWNFPFPRIQPSVPALLMEYRRIILINPIFKCNSVSLVYLYRLYRDTPISLSKHAEKTKPIIPPLPVINQNQTPTNVCIYVWTNKTFYKDIISAFVEGRRIIENACHRFVVRKSIGKKEFTFFFPPLF